MQALLTQLRVTEPRFTPNSHHRITFGFHHVAHQNHTNRVGIKAVNCQLARTVGFQRLDAVEHVVKPEDTTHFHAGHRQHDALLTIERRRCRHAVEVWCGLLERYT